MASYLVTWRIDIEAANVWEAAARALIIQRDNDEANTATVFDVTGPDGQTVTVDAIPDLEEPQEKV